jgi:hypothetical protein
MGDFAVRGFLCRTPFFNPAHSRGAARLRRERDVSTALMDLISNQSASSTAVIGKTRSVNGLSRADTSPRRGGGALRL